MVEKDRRPGFYNSEAHVRYFNTQFVRGPKDTGLPGFHLVVTNDPKGAPPVPHESIAHRLYDQWLGSLPQRMLRFAIYGY